MIILDGEIMKANKAAQKIVWLYGAQWARGDLESYGINESELTKEEKLELVEQLKKQENRVRGLFGF